MPIEFRCGACQTLLRVGDEFAGRQAKCPKCGVVMTVPAASPPPTSPPPAESGNPFASGPTSELGSVPPPPAGDPANPYSSPANYEMPPTWGATGVTALVPSLITVEDSFSHAWAIFKQRLGFCIGAWVLIFVISLGFQWIVDLSCNVFGQLSRDQTAAVMIVVLGKVIIQVFSLWLTGGQIRTFLLLSRGEDVSVGDIFSGGPYLLRLVGAGILYSLIVLAGLLLLVVPGIVLGLMFSQCFNLIIDRDMGVLESLERSREITSGNKWTFFLIWLCVLGLVVLAVLTLCLGFIVLAPFLLVLFPVAYLAMTGQRTADQVSYYTPPTPGFAEA